MPPAVNLSAQIQAALDQVKAARVEGDQLRVELAEAALNDLMDRNRDTLVTLATRNRKEGSK